MDLHNNGKKLPEGINQNHYQYTHRVNSYDPNLGSAARYSPPFATNTAHSDEPDYTNVSYSNVIYVPNSGISETQNNMVDPTQSYILSPDPRLFNTYVRTGNETEENGNENYEEPIVITDMEIHHQIENYEYGADHNHETDINSTNTQIVLQGSNGQYYRQIPNIYVNNRANTVGLGPPMINDNINDYGVSSYTEPYKIDSNLDVCAQGKQSNEIHCDAKKADQVQMMVNNSYHYKNEYTVLEPMNRQILQSHQQNIVELTDYHNQAPIMQNQIAIQPTIDEKEQQRILLESTMSPLLAAVNDITSRDEQFQNYLAQNTVKDNIDTQQNFNQFDHTNSYVDNKLPSAGLFETSTPQNNVECFDSNYRNNLKITNVHSVANEYVDINDMDFIENRSSRTNTSHIESDRNQENLLMRRSQRKIKKDDDLMVSDKHVPCRAWASLPTSYLCIRKSVDNITEYTIFSKKDIPPRTKFGPFEGDLKQYTVSDINIFKDYSTRHLPLLLLADNKVLDVSNEYSSNWMRFVRLANNFTEQNLQLHEFENKLYFKSCQFIGPKQELKVGYSLEYSERYGLKYLMPDENEKIALYAKEHPWPCFECDKKFEHYEALQSHLNEHDDNKPVKTPQNKRRTRKKRTVRRFKLSSRKISGPTVRYACCYCSEVFSKFISLKRHNEFAHSFVDLETRNNSVLTNSNKENTNKNFKCDLCRRYFSSVERLEKHKQMHCTTVDSKLVQCTYCPKRLLTPSALAMHVKSHFYKNRLFNCLFCMERFQLATEVMSHVQIHMEDGQYNCPHCNKKFKEYTVIRKHIRCYHSTVRFSCPECGRDFKSRTKLKHHRLRHSDVREFLCSDCGKQFKRKDKLREHIIGIHSKEKTTEVTKDQVTNDTNISKDKNEVKTSKFIAKVAPTDYQRFIYKCHDCLLGFKRRGMLVNHLAKRHPDISIDSVPELNLPILKAQRYYYCQYCEKVYKSSGKRKAHILKYHPGSDLPLSSRQKAPDIPGQPNPSFSETVGNVTTHPQRCLWCHKQYASKARLLQHQRKLHGGHLKDIELSAQHLEIDSDNMAKINTTHFEQSSHRFVGFESENKLLKLSSAALGASFKDDFQFFHNSKPLQSVDLADENTALSKVDVNFKVVDGDFVETLNGDLNRLPELFEDIDYMNLKSVSLNDHLLRNSPAKKHNF